MNLPTRSFMIMTAVALSFGVRANDIQVTNVNLVSNTGTSVNIQFDISWQNSWRGSGAPNHDAAWVFVKFRLSNGIWQHARLGNTGHVAPSGAQIDLGLQTPGTAFNTTTNPVLGVFIRRSADGVGAFSAPATELRWNYADQIALFGDVSEVRVFAIEMVHVNQGAFFVGSGGTESGSFTNGSWTTGNTIPLQITSEAALTVGPSAGALWGTSSTGSNTIGPTGSLPAAFPKGFQAFYTMKYEISQQQYVDFLNTLTRTQQAARVRTDIAPGITSTIMVNVMLFLGVVQDRQGIRCPPTFDANAPLTFFCDLFTNGSPGGQSSDGLWVPCNHLNWTDVAAYLDWSGLRPMSELEYEKSCRGPLPPNPNEFAWGTSTVTTTPYTFGATGFTNEGIGTNYSTSAGNALYSATLGTLGGPVRVGAFAANPANTGRMTAGASYWGIMELTGNLWERPVSVGNTGGRAFIGNHGDGALSSAGSHDAATWPGTDAVGSGFRGGTWTLDATAMYVSSRTFASLTFTPSTSLQGGRGVRTAP